MNRYLIHIIMFLVWTIWQFPNAFGSIEFHEKMIEIEPEKNIRIVSTMPYTEFSPLTRVPPMLGDSLQEVITKVPKFGFDVAEARETPSPIFLILGRTMFVELCTPFIETCVQQKNQVISYDHPGQGLSFRTINPCGETHCNFDLEKKELCDNCQRGHINSYDQYVEALRYVLVSTVAAYNHYNKDIQEDQFAFDFPKKFRVMAHSMGSAIWLMFVHKYHSIAKICVEDVTLISPMIRFMTDPYPYQVTKFVAWIMSQTKYTSQLYVLGHGPISKDRDNNFEKNKVIGNKEDYEKTKEQYFKHPKKIVSGTTFGWLRASHVALDVLFEKFQKHKINELKTVVFIPTQEHLLHNEETVKFFKGHALVFQLEGMHNLINETAGMNKILEYMWKYPNRENMQLDNNSVDF